MTSRRASLLAIVLLLVQPLLWLWPCLFGDRVLVPYDTAEFPPASVPLTAEQVAGLRAGSNKDVTELPVWFLPELELARDEVRAGRLPVWDPHARGGSPLHAHGLLGLCYPPVWMALLADDPAARLGIVCWISLVLAGLGAFGLLREVDLSVQAAWFGATLFQLGGPMAANGFFWMRLASHAWLPVLLWALLRLGRAPRLQPLAFAAVAVAFAMPWLAGFPPFATTTILLGGLLALRVLAERLARDGDRAARGIALRLAAALGLGALLAMPQVLPSLAFFPHSARETAPTLASITNSRFDPYGLFGYLLPDAFGHPTLAERLPYGQSPLPLWLCDRIDDKGKGALPNYNYTEYSVFFGTLGLLLAGYGAVRGRSHLRWTLIVCLLLLLGLALVAPGVRWLYLLPVVKNVWPLRWLVPAALPLAWLAAIGLDRLWLVERRSLVRLAAIALGLAVVVPWAATRPAAWHRADPTWPATAIAGRVQVSLQTVVDYVQAGAPQGLDRFAAAGEQCASAGWEAGLWLLGCGGALLAFALLERRPDVRRWLVRGLLLATVAQLAQHGRPLLHGIDRRVPTETPVHAFLREQAVAHAADGGFTIARGSLGEMLQIQLPPGQLFAPGIRDLHFYSHFDGRSIEPLLRLLGGEFGKRNCAKGYLTTALPDTRSNPMPGESPPPVPAPFAHPLEHPLLDLLGVRFVLAIQPLEHAGARVGPQLRGPGGEFFVYERPHPLPRAFVVPELRALPDDDAVLGSLVDPAFAPREVVFATAADAATAGLEPARSGAAGERTVRFTHDSPAAIDLDVGPGRAPWLVLTDTFLPGWTATVDGAPVPIGRADHALRVVRLPDSACHVRFTYAAPGLVPGLALAGIAALALLAVGFRARGRSTPGPAA